MKKILSLLVLLGAGLFFVPDALSKAPIPGSRDARREVAKKLYGRIKIVQDSVFADYRVYVSDPSMADLRVCVNESFCDKPGRWRFVDDGSWDFRIFFTDSSASAHVHVTFVDDVGGAGPMP